MEKRSEKYEQVRNALPEYLREAFDHLVGDYKFCCAVRCGYKGIAYDVMADLIRYGWRLNPELKIEEHVKPGLKGVWLVEVVDKDGNVSHQERNEFNEAGRIVCHAGFGAIIDEGIEGQDPKRVYKNIQEVEFTDEIREGHRVCRLIKGSQDAQSLKPTVP